MKSEVTDLSLLTGVMPGRFDGRRLGLGLWVGKKILTALLLSFANELCQQFSTHTVEWHFTIFVRLRAFDIKHVPRRMSCKIMLKSRVDLPLRVRPNT